MSDNEKIAKAILRRSWDAFSGTTHQGTAEQFITEALDAKDSRPVCEGKLREAHKRNIDEMKYGKPEEGHACSYRVRLEAVFERSKNAIQTPSSCECEKLKERITWLEHELEIQEGFLNDAQEKAKSFESSFNDAVDKWREAQDCLDLMADEFKRIYAIAESSEIRDLCQRAQMKILQTVPVIEQRDKAEKSVANQMAIIDRLTKETFELKKEIAHLKESRSRWAKQSSENADSFEALEAECARLREEVAFLSDKYKRDSWESTIKVLTAELETQKEITGETQRNLDRHITKCENLRETLIKYGNHKKSCPWWRDAGPCDCGWREALATHPQEPKKVSDCCRASLEVETADEGTSCYICGKCGKPCDAAQETKEVATADDNHTKRIRND